MTKLFNELVIGFPPDMGRSCMALLDCFCGKALASDEEEKQRVGVFAAIPMLGPEAIGSMFRLFLMLIAVVALGLLSRLRPVGWYLYDKSLGDILYAVAAYLVLALLLFRWRQSRVTLLSLALCLGVESFQATGILARYEHIAPVRWLLGTTFSWHDVGCYFVGIGLIWAIDAMLLRPCQSRKTKQ